MRSTIITVVNRISRCAQVIEKVRPGTGREAGLGHARRPAGVEIS